MPISIHSRDAVTYPAGDHSYSPDQAYPEYRFGDVSPAPNPVYAMVREILAEHGLDASRYGSDEWNPLRERIPAGARVFVLCNFVYHRRPQESAQDFYAKCVHGSVLRALVDYVLLAVGPRGRVLFGNAPLRSCDWKAVQAETGAEQVARYYAERGMPVEARDLRLVVTRRGRAGGVTRVADRDATSSAREIDLASESLLDQQPTATRSSRSNYRVSDYDSSRTEEFHRDGSHRYVIHRDVLESDVVISLSKLKTHEKVGITCGLKGFVGAVGHKDCLAHHRYGSPLVGGDEYPSRHAYLQPLSALHDWVYRRGPDALLQRFAQSTDRILRTGVRRAGAITSGAWHGNDTAWRMALDLARILRYADAQGVLGDVPCRRHLALIDGIVAGEGEGPLDPEPVASGALVFGDDVALADRIACRLMGFDASRIPLVHEAFAGGARPISDHDHREVVCRMNGESVSERDLREIAGRSFEPPSGWRDHL